MVFLEDCYEPPGFLISVPCVPLNPPQWEQMDQLDQRAQISWLIFLLVFIRTCWQHADVVYRCVAERKITIPQGATLSKGEDLCHGLDDNNNYSFSATLKIRLLPVILVSGLWYNSSFPSVPNLFWILQRFWISFVALPCCNNTKALSAEKIPHWNVLFIHNHISARILSSSLLQQSPSSLLSQHVQKTCHHVSLLYCAIDSIQFNKGESSQWDKMAYR